MTISIYSYSYLVCNPISSLYTENSFTLYEGTKERFQLPRSRRHQSLFHAFVISFVMECLNGDQITVYACASCITLNLARGSHEYHNEIHFSPVHTNTQICLLLEIASSSCGIVPVCNRDGQLDNRAAIFF